MACLPPLARRAVLSPTLAAVLSLGLLAASAGCGGETAADADMAQGEADLAELPDMRTPDLVAPPACDDKQKNGRESDVDCGGDCGPCAAGKVCTGAADCDSKLCLKSRCAEPSCADGLKDNDESDVDCGGSCESKCNAGKACKRSDDCRSLICMQGLCVQSGCADGVANGTETDIDCGGGACVPCGAGGKCVKADDCASKLCDAGSLVCTVK